MGFVADAVVRNTTCLIGQLSSREHMLQEHPSLVGKTRDLRDLARDPLQNVGDHGDLEI